MVTSFPAKERSLATVRQMSIQSRKQTLVTTLKSVSFFFFDFRPEKKIDSVAPAPNAYNTSGLNPKGLSE